MDFEGLVARMKKVAKDTPAIHEIQDDIKDFVGEILVKQEKLHNEHAVSASNHFLRNKFIATLTDRAKQIVMVLPYDEQLQIRKDFHKYDAPPDAAFASATPVGAAAAEEATKKAAEEAARKTATALRVKEQHWPLFVQTHGDAEYNRKKVVEFIKLVGKLLPLRIASEVREKEEFNSLIDGGLLAAETATESGFKEALNNSYTSLTEKIDDADIRHRSLVMMWLLFLSNKLQKKFDGKDGKSLEEGIALKKALLPEGLKNLDTYLTDERAKAANTKPWRQQWESHQEEQEEEEIGNPSITADKQIRQGVDQTISKWKRAQEYANSVEGRLVAAGVISGIGESERKKEEREQQVHLTNIIKQDEERIAACNDNNESEPYLVSLEKFFYLTYMNKKLVAYKDTFMSNIPSNATCAETVSFGKPKDSEIQNLGINITNIIGDFIESLIELSNDMKYVLKSDRMALYNVITPTAHYCNELYIHLKRLDNFIYVLNEMRDLLEDISQEALQQEASEFALGEVLKKVNKFIITAIKSNLYIRGDGGALRAIKSLINSKNKLTNYQRLEVETHIKLYNLPEGLPVPHGDHWREYDHDLARLLYKINRPNMLPNASQGTADELVEELINEKFIRNRAGAGQLFHGQQGGHRPLSQGGEVTQVVMEHALDPTRELQNERAKLEKQGLLRIVFSPKQGLLLGAAPGPEAVEKELTDSETAKAIEDAEDAVERKERFDRQRRERYDKMQEGMRRSAPTHPPEAIQQQPAPPPVPPKLAAAPQQQQPPLWIGLPIDLCEAFTGYSQGSDMSGVKAPCLLDIELSDTLGNLICKSNAQVTEVVNNDLSVMMSPSFHIGLDNKPPEMPIPSANVAPQVGSDFTVIKGADMVSPATEELAQQNLIQERIDITTSIMEISKLPGADTDEVKAKITLLDELRKAVGKKQKAITRRSAADDMVRKLLQRALREGEKATVKEDAAAEAAAAAARLAEPHGEVSLTEEDEEKKRRVLEAKLAAEEAKEEAKEEARLTVVVAKAAEAAEEEAKEAALAAEEAKEAALAAEEAARLTVVAAKAAEAAEEEAKETEAMAAAVAEAEAAVTEEAATQLEAVKQVAKGALSSGLEAANIFEKGFAEVHSQYDATDRTLENAHAKEEAAKAAAKAADDAKEQEAKATKASFFTRAIRIWDKGVTQLQIVCTANCITTLAALKQYLTDMFLSIAAVINKTFENIQYIVTYLWSMLSTALGTLFKWFTGIISGLAGLLAEGIAPPLTFLGKLLGLIRKSGASLGQMWTAQSKDTIATHNLYFLCTYLLTTIRDMVSTIFGTFPVPLFRNISLGSVAPTIESLSGAIINTLRNAGIVAEGAKNILTNLIFEVGKFIYKGTKGGIEEFFEIIWNVIKLIFGTIGGILTAGFGAGMKNIPVLMTWIIKKVFDLMGWLSMPLNYGLKITKAWTSALCMYALYICKYIVAIIHVGFMNPAHEDIFSDTGEEDLFDEAYERWPEPDADLDDGETSSFKEDREYLSAVLRGIGLTNDYGELQTKYGEILTQAKASKKRGWVRLFIKMIGVCIKWCTQAAFTGASAAVMAAAGLVTAGVSLTAKGVSKAAPIAGSAAQRVIFGLVQFLWAILETLWEARTIVTNAIKLTTAAAGTIVMRVILTAFTSTVDIIEGVIFGATETMARIGSNIFIIMSSIVSAIIALIRKREDEGEDGYAGNNELNDIVNDETGAVSALYNIVVEIWKLIMKYGMLLVETAWNIAITGGSITSIVFHWTTDLIANLLYTLQQKHLDLHNTTTFTLSMPLIKFPVIQLFYGQNEDGDEDGDKDRRRELTPSFKKCPNVPGYSHQYYCEPGSNFRKNTNGSNSKGNNAPCVAAETPEAAERVCDTHYEDYQLGADAPWHGVYSKKCTVNGTGEECKD